MKDEFIDAFQTWLFKIENESGQSMKTLCADRRGKFMFIKLRDFCNKKGLILKYVTSYIHKENDIAEKGRQIIVTMKDLLLLDSKLPLDFWTKAMDTANYLQNRLPTKSQQRQLIPKEA